MISNWSFLRNIKIASYKSIKTARLLYILSSATLYATRISANNYIQNRDVEKSLWDRGLRHIIGVDEAGRGPLAGPVIAASVCAPPEKFINGVGDSKKLTEKMRNNIYEIISNDPSYFITFCAVDHRSIDEINILKATMTAMNDSVKSLIEKFKLVENSCYVLIDGHKIPNKLSVTCKPVIRGDALVYPIALASIIAKVERDKIMCEYDKLYPQYGFASHKGYATSAHIRAIHQYGPCPIHRMSFKPLKGR